MLQANRLNNRREHMLGGFPARSGYNYPKIQGKFTELWKMTSHVFTSGEIHWKSTRCNKIQPLDGGLITCADMFLYLAENQMSSESELLVKQTFLLFTGIKVSLILRVIIVSEMFAQG